MTRSFLCLAALLAAATPAIAQTDAQSRADSQLSVHTRDLDLGRPSDVKTLYARIRLVAHDACRSDVSDPRTANDDAVCEAQAVSDAVRSVNNPLLSQLDGQPAAQMAATAENDGRNAYADNQTTTR